MAFIIETWINKEEDLQLITSQLKCLGYNIITKKDRITRKAVELANIYRDDLTVEKLNI